MERLISSLTEKPLSKHGGLPEKFTFVIHDIGQFSWSLNTIVETTEVFHFAKIIAPFGLSGSISIMLIMKINYCSISRVWNILWCLSVI